MKMDNRGKTWRFSPQMVEFGFIKKPFTRDEAIKMFCPDYTTLQANRPRGQYLEVDDLRRGDGKLFATVKESVSPCRRILDRVEHSSSFRVKPISE